MTSVITYGTFDLFHVGHVRLLNRARALGDRLIVGVSTDDFNLSKGKRAVVPFAERREIVGSLRCVDLVIPEHDWEQKESDIRSHGVSIFVMGEDWAGEFDHLLAYCEVEYLSRTEGVSTTILRESISLDRPRAWLDAVNG
jgi:glycerol-3-phosphate cytidylyltransferase